MKMLKQFGAFALGSLLVILSVSRSARAVPSIAIGQDGPRVAITFSGKLEAADQLAGPWLEITNAPNPFSDEISKSGRFYRSRDNASIFSSSSVVTLEMTGPLQTNFNLAYAGTPDGIFPPKRLKPYFDARCKMDSLEIPVTMRVRGNSSLQECSFPKLKMKVGKENRPGTPFEDAREIKIGTHCAEGGRGNIGRLRDERTAWREALAYEMMDILGFTAPRVRRAIIRYHDTGEPDDFGNSGWTVNRHAFMAESVELVAARLGGRALADDELSSIRTNNVFSPQLITDLELLHALLGNWDFSLDAEGRGIWNTDVIELANKSLLPVAGDFDLSSFVTGFVQLSAPSDYHPEMQDVERQALYRVESLLASAGAERFANGRQRFLQHRTAIEARINSAEIDEDGRANALRHIAAFYNALSTVSLSRGGK